MTFEENRAFSTDSFRIVEPLSQHFVGVVLDYWQIYEGPNSTLPGPFLREYGMTGLDTAGQVILSPDAELLSTHRSWKNGNGFTRKELYELASRHGGPVANRDHMKLSWLMIDPNFFAIDLGRNQPAQFCSADGAIHHARKMRRPLIRVDGAAQTLLEDHAEFLQRHARQFWWQKGGPEAKSRLVVLNGHQINEIELAPELTGRCSAGRVPTMMANIDIHATTVTDRAQLDELTSQLDRCWLEYMTNRPSNAENLTFARDNIANFQQIDIAIRELAKQQRLLAPGGRVLHRR